MIPDLKGILDSRRLAIARALSFVENQTDVDTRFLDSLTPYLGKAQRIGVTGPPGAGKSSLVDHLIFRFREQGHRVAVLSVDPSSPFTGGAILGDRVRMTRHHGDRDVFIRSMATRGSYGGLSMRSQDAADVLDVAGFDIILFETVGVGQVELDVAQAADTTVVVLVPESGDDIQAMKAGLMEIADLFVINKADRQGANQAQIQLQSMLEMKPEEGDWQPPVLKTSAIRGEGLAELVSLLMDHARMLRSTGRLAHNLSLRLELKIRGIIDDGLHREFWTEPREDYLREHLQPQNASAVRPGDLIRELQEI